MGPGIGWDWFLVAMAHWKKGDKDDVRKWFDRAVDWTRRHVADDPAPQCWSEAAELLGQPGPGARPVLARAYSPRQGTLNEKPFSHLERFILLKNWRADGWLFWYPTGHEARNQTQPRKVHVVNAPEGHLTLLEPLPEGVKLADALSKSIDIVHIFASSKAELASALGSCRKTLKPTAVIWVSWPKKSSKVPTDITEDTIRELALPLGFVDIKVCASPRCGRV